jgi:hypothetical protein
MLSQWRGDFVLPPLLLLQLLLASKGQAATSTAYVSGPLVRPKGGCLPWLPPVFQEEVV